jgi:hypothetical protein
MMPDLGTLLRRAAGSVTDPAEAARWVMRFEMPRGARWEALLLVVVISVILAQITVALLGPPPEETALSPIFASPVTTGIVQACLLVIAVFAIYWIGRAMGGIGGFGETILLVAWLQFCMVCLQLAQTAALLLLPPLANLIGVAGFALFFWLLTSFVAELHGFASRGRVFVMILFSLLALVFGASMILAMIGATVPGVPTDV